MKAVAENTETTLELINKVAFTYMLEKGYEGTYMRKVSDEVGIKTASLYFYYKSKKDMFLTILNKIFEDQYEAKKDVLKRNQDLPPRDQLFIVFRSIINACTFNSDTYKFIIRYRFFPEEEIRDESRMLFEQWFNEEFDLMMPILLQSIATYPELKDTDIQWIYHQYQKLQNSIICEILISGLAIKEEEIIFSWDKFWDNCTIKK